MKYKGYLIDLDGTMYKGTEKIEEAGQFVQKLNELNIPYLFVTNNSSRTPKQVAENSFHLISQQQKNKCLQQVWRRPIILLNKRKMRQFT